MRKVNVTGPRLHSDLNESEKMSQFLKNLIVSLVEIITAMYLILVNYGLMVGRKVQYKTFHQLNVLWSFENWQKKWGKRLFQLCLKTHFLDDFGLYVKKNNPILCTPSIIPFPNG